MRLANNSAHVLGSDARAAVFVTQRLVRSSQLDDAVRAPELKLDVPAHGPLPHHRRGVGPDVRTPVEGEPGHLHLLRRVCSGKEVDCQTNLAALVVSPLLPSPHYLPTRPTPLTAPSLP